MEGKERREKILEILSKESEPILGKELAKRLEVSRQIIVQDIALLRVANKNILSTIRGYLLYYEEKKKVNRCYMVKHTTEQIKDELCCIIDNGGSVLDVIVEHEIYGQISVDLIIKTRQEINDFVERVRTKDMVPLKKLTKGVHFHTIEAESEEILDKIEKILKEKKYLLNE